MIVQLIFKILLAYFLYVIGKGLWNAYKTVKLLKSAQNSGRQNPFENQSGPGPQNQNKGAQSTGDVFEAEYRVLKDKKE
jgi:hypothetical protein